MNSDFQFFFSLFHTPQLVHKIFLFYIFYTNVTKRWEGRGGRQTVFMPINQGREVDEGLGAKQKTHGLCGNMERSDSKTWREVGLRDGREFSGLYSQGEMALCSR